MTRLTLLLLAAAALPNLSPAANVDAVIPFTPTRELTYKHVGNVDLKLEIFDPPAALRTPHAPAIVLFFGGGWISGAPRQMYPQCAAFAARGMVAIAADYRTKSKENVTPRECVIDGKSCLRWVQAHASELGIDPGRIAAGGGSAGGHVAMAAAILPGFDDPAAPDHAPIHVAALVLWNPVVDNGPGGYGYDRVKDYYQEISPLHNLKAGIPPTLAMWGTADKLVPVTTGQKLQAEITRLGNRCEVIFYANQQHGFFNWHAAGSPYFDQTMAAAETFLTSLKLLPSPTR